MTDENLELQDSEELDILDEDEKDVEEVDESTEEESTDDSDKIKQLLVRTQKAEKKAKEAKAELERIKANPDTTSLTREEAVLIAKGMDEADLDILATIQKSSGINLKEAQESALFKAYLKDKQSKVKKDKAQLPASKTYLGLNKYGKPLTEEEHRAKFKELTSKL